MTAWNDKINRLLGTSMDTFGEEITFTPLSGSPFQVQAVFDETYEELDVSAGVIVQSINPRIGVRMIDILPNMPGARNPDKGDETTIRGVTYRIIEYRTDGQGGASMMLHKK